MNTNHLNKISLLSHYYKTILSVVFVVVHQCIGINNIIKIITVFLSLKSNKYNEGVSL